MIRLLCSLILLGACARDVDKPSLAGPYPCGALTCSTGQVCVTVESGSQCGVNEDAGVGPYQVYRWSCVDLPARCDGEPSCDCLGAAPSCSESGRTIATGCI